MARMKKAFGCVATEGFGILRLTLLEFSVDSIGGRHHAA